MGFEIPDILALMLTVSILNFVFGQTPLKLYFVWTPSICLAAILSLGKKNKPDNFLIHWVRYQFRPGVLRSFSDSGHTSFFGTKGDADA
jgi:hypothetical protein